MSCSVTTWTVRPRCSTSSMSEHPAHIIAGSLSATDDDSIDYVCQVMRSMYGLCCDFNVACMMLGTAEPINCDGTKNGMLN